MSVLLRFFTYLRWPVITGIIIGLSIMVLFPDLIRPQQTNIVPHPPENTLLVQHKTDGAAQSLIQAPSIARRHLS